MTLTRKKLRLQHWNYSENGYYFVTICTFKKVNWFGSIENDEMRLSEVGEVVQKCWEEIPKHFSGIELDYFVIMPNHIHGIVIIDKEIDDATKTLANGFPVANADLRSLRDGNDRSRMILCKVIHGFKSSVSRTLNKIPDFSWQRSFYDHIITTDKDLSNTRDYITNNPLKWQFDQENTALAWK